MIRPATPADIPVLESLIAASARALGTGFYTEAETEAAIAHVFGVDSDLVADGTYMIAADDATLLGCGGWSARRTLFGGDRFAARAAGFLDPKLDPARIRAFFVAPGYARRGVGAALLGACEAAAAAAGFGVTALMATLPGVPFYTRHGYRAGPGVVYDCGGVPVRFVPMDKALARVSAFDRQPYLASPAVHLRPLLSSDRDALFAVASDPLIWADHPDRERWRRPVFDRFFDAAIQSGGALAATDPATGAIIGSSRYDYGRAGADEIEIGWTFLARSYWGQRVNAAMKALMAAHALGHHERVLFFVGEANLRSRRAMEKIGGILTDRRPTAIISGEMVRHVVYMIDRAAFGMLRAYHPQGRYAEPNGD